MRRQPPEPWRALWVDADGYDRWLEAKVSEYIRQGDMWAAKGAYRHLREMRVKRARREQRG